MVEKKEGTLLRFTSDDTGFVDDSTNPGAEHPFEHMGARPTFVEGDVVTYLLIKNPGTTKAVNLGRPQ